MAEEDLNYRLYFIVRTSMASMTPGRIAAQANHAGSRFNTLLSSQPKAGIYPHFQKWSQETPQNFGTTIILRGYNLEHARETLRRMRWESPVHYEEITDPSYAIRDGEDTFFVPAVTGINLFASVFDYTVFRNSYNNTAEVDYSETNWAGGDGKRKELCLL